MTKSIHNHSTFHRLCHNFRLFAILLLTLFVSTSIYATTPTQSETLPNSLFSTKEMSSVMTFNLRRMTDRGDRSWEKRRPVVSNIIQQYNPLFVGTQEGFHQQIEEIKIDLPHYRSVGVSRMGNQQDEYSAILYDTTRVTLSSSGDFWLSETPENAGSIMPGTGHPRIVSWGEFQITGVTQPVYLFNTHLSLEEAVSERQVLLMLQKIEQITAGKNAEVLISGDFNVIRLSHIWQHFINVGFQDAWQLAHYQSGPNFSFHGWNGIDATTQEHSKEKSGYVIDWILQRGAKLDPNNPLLVDIVTQSEGNIHASDHFPVVLTTLGKAETTTHNTEVSKSEIASDELFTTTAKLKNRGGKGVVASTLYVNFKPIDTQWIVLNAQQEREVRFLSRLYQPGSHNIMVDRTQSTKISVIPSSATFHYQSLSVSPYIQIGQTVPITTTVRNSGSFSGSNTTNLFINNRMANTTQSTLNAGEQQEIGFAQTFNQAGVYQITVGGEQKELSVMLDLPSSWRFAKGDDLKRSQKNFNDANWQVVTLPAAWEEHSNYLADDVYGWYRTSFHVPKEWQGKSVRLVLGRIDDVDRAFINGTFVGQTGSFPKDKEGFQSEWGKTRVYTIPPSLIQYGQENSIAIRVFDAGGGGGLYGGPLGFLPLHSNP